MTTTKVALIGEKGELLYSYYAGNSGSPIETARTAMRELMEKMPDTAVIARSCSTGYGESLLKSAFRLDDGEVETLRTAPRRRSLTRKWTVCWILAGRT